MSTLLDEQTDTTIKTLPPHNVIIENDDDHSIEYVIGVIQKVFRYDLDKAVLHTMEIHKSGRTIVWSGSKEVAELKHDQIQTFKKEIRPDKTVEYPLKSYVESA